MLFLPKILTLKIANVKFASDYPTDCGYVEFFGNKSQEE